MKKRTVFAIGVLVALYGIVGAIAVVAVADVAAPPVPAAAVPSPPPTVDGAKPPAAPAVDQQQAQQARDAELLRQAYQSIVDARAALAKQAPTAPAAPVIVAPAPVVTPVPSNTLVDFSQAIVEPLLQVIALVIAGLFAVYVPKVLDAFEKRTGIQLTEAQKNTVLMAVKTAAGVVETKIDQKAMSVAQVHIDDPNIREQARMALAAVPQAAAALGVTESGVARMIVGMADTGSRSAPMLPVAPAPAPVQAAPSPLVSASNGGTPPNRPL